MKMNNSVALNKILKQLRNERDRFIKASNSGHFSDSEHCDEVAFVLTNTIMALKKSRDNI